RYDFLRHIERPPEMNVHGVDEVLAFHMLQGADLDDAGVVDQDIDAAVTVDDLRHGLFDLLGLAHVAFERRHRPAARHEFGGDVWQLIALAGNHDDSGALAREAAHELQAETARPAGDQHRPAAEIDPSLFAEIMRSRSGGSADCGERQQSRANIARHKFT